MVAQPPPVCGPEARAASLPLRLRQSPHIYRNGVGIEDDIPVIGAVEMQEGLDIFPRHAASAQDIPDVAASGKNGMSGRRLSAAAQKGHYHILHSRYGLCPASRSENRFSTSMLSGGLSKFQASCTSIPSNPFSSTRDAQSFMRGSSASGPAGSHSEKR